jgi:hypothetical protein
MWWQMFMNDVSQDKVEDLRGDLNRGAPQISCYM